MCEHFDQTALARARNARDANANGIATVGKAVFEDALSQLAVSRARAFDQSDGLRQNGALTFEDAIDVLLVEREQRRFATRASNSCGGSVAARPGRTRSALSLGSVNQERPPTRLPLRISKIFCAATGITVPGPKMPPPRPGTGIRSPAEE